MSDSSSYEGPGEPVGSAGGSAVAALMIGAIEPAAGGDLNYQMAREDLNDLGNARRLIRRHGDDLLYINGVGWHCWDGRHWAVDDDKANAVRRKAHDTVATIRDEFDALSAARAPAGVSASAWDQRLEKLAKWSIAAGNKARIEAMLSEARPYLSELAAAMDADGRLLNLANGTLPLEGACDALRDHARGDRMAKIMDVEFDPEATCPEFDVFFAEVQPNPEIRRFLQMWIGYCLTGDTSEQKLVFNYGRGMNGKSVFTDLMARILGPYAVSLPFTSLLHDERRGGGDATPDLARLPGARMVRASEPEKGSQLAEATIKAITGGEAMTVRHLNKGFFEFTPNFKLILSGNDMPVIRGQDRGIWRRFILVPWVVTIDEAHDDKRLKEKLWRERSGVLNWILDGLRLWLEQGLVVPPSVRGATERYKADSDPLGRFLAGCVEAAPGENVQASVIYGAYRDWCAANAERAWKQAAFGRGLRERGMVRRDGARRFYLDIRLVNVPAPPASPEDGG